MFSKAALVFFSLNALLTQGFQLRGSTTASRNLDEEETSSTCIPAEAPFTKTAYVAVDLSGPQAFNASTTDLEDLATAFELTYGEQVDCSAIEGSRREIGRTNTLIEAVGPAGVASQLLRVDIFCNACGDSDEIALFRDSPTTREDPVDDVSGVECACDGPFIPTFVDLYNEIFAATTNADIVITDVDQLAVLDCGDQNFTSFNASGVCLGPDALAFQADLEAPSAAPTTFPSEYPSEFPSEFPTEFPSEVPTAGPSENPTVNPTTESPTDSPTVTTPSPTITTPSPTVSTPSPTVSTPSPTPTVTEGAVVDTSSPTASERTTPVTTPAPTEGDSVIEEQDEQQLEVAPVVVDEPAEDEPAEEEPETDEELTENDEEPANDETEDDEKDEQEEQEDEEVNDEPEDDEETADDEKDEQEDEENDDKDDEPEEEKEDEERDAEPQEEKEDPEVQAILEEP